MDAKLRNRKRTRLKEYDYSQAGYYHITICTKDNLPILSNVKVGLGLAPATVELTSKGIITEEQLLDLPNRYENVRIDKYVIMPTHIHFIIVLEKVDSGRRPAARASPSPTIMGVVGAFKSISTRMCNQYDNTVGRKIWQPSFYDEVIRNDAAYNEIWTYIDSNPAKWLDDTYCT